MATPVLLPKQGNSVEECLIVAWKKKAGEVVAEGEPIAEMETDKASFELTAPAAGKILALFVNEGELAPVLTNVAVIGADGEDFESLRPAKKKAAPVAAAAAVAAPVAATVSGGGEVAAVAAPVATLTPAAPAAPERLQGVASPRAREFAARHGIDYKSLTGRGITGRIMDADVRAAYYAGPRVSYLARKLLTEGYEQKRKGGSGVAGLLRSADLRKGQPLSNVRKVIAQRMSASLKEHAQLTLNSAACAENILACRAKFKGIKDNPALAGVTVGDLIMLAVIRALEAHPEINCEYSKGKVYAGDGVHIAFACDTPKGLLVPVVHNAQKLSLPEISARIKQLAAEAVAGNISPDNLEGGTFTVSNLGALGIESFTPVLNAPHVGILGGGAPVTRPVRVGGAVEYKDYIGLSLTIDHQVVDGAPGAKFLHTVKKNMENVAQLAGVAL